jgi:NSS family neurotransmitter:Na+ symporter
MENQSKQQRDGFSSKLGVIMAAAGSAIGLGNIWKFPYVTGIYGGAAFILIYLLCIILIGLPVMLSELLVGRKGQKNAIGSFKAIAPGTPWYITGTLGVSAAFMILAFYGVVAGWTLEYIYMSIVNAFSGMNPAALETTFTTFISNPYKPIIWQMIFMAITAIIVIIGIKDGIEKFTKFLMPLLLVIIVILCIRSITLPGAKAGLEFLFKPDFSKLTGEGVLNALGHAFFSLSLGMGILLTYGSYINKDDNLAETAVQVTFLDTFIAILAGVAIFPAVFAFNIEPSAGPGLVFITLPNVFQQMHGGYIFGLLFFTLLAVAALTSSVSILEVVVAYLAEELKLTRKKATILGALSTGILGIFCSLSMGSLDHFKIFGMNIFDLLDFISANILMPLSGLLIIVFVGWYLGRKVVKAEVSNNGMLHVKYFKYFMFLAKFVSPVAIAIVFLHGLGFFK